MNIKITKFSIAELFGLEFVEERYSGKDGDYSSTYVFRFHGHDIVIRSSFQINEDAEAKEEAADIVLKAIGKNSVQGRTRF